MQKTLIHTILKPMLATNLKTGVVFKESDIPYQVQRYAHSKVARGGAHVKVQARNLKTGALKRFTFQGNKSVEAADVFKKKVQYLYKDTDYVFMDPKTYEQITISKEAVGDSARFLAEGSVVTVQYFEDTPIAIELPNVLVFEVSYTEPGFKGNTVSNVYKDATLSNGIVIKVPNFIKTGDKVKVNTTEGTYTSKA